jgi:hypothetical protein
VSDIARSVNFMAQSHPAAHSSQSRKNISVLNATENRIKYNENKAA